jgi:hypothetical protein
MPRKSRIESEEKSVKSKSRAKPAEDSQLGKRTRKDSEVEAIEEESGIELDEALLEEAAPLFDTMNSKALQRARELRATTTRALGRKLTKINESTEVWVKPESMTVRKEMQLKDLPAQAIELNNIVEKVNDYTGQQEDLQMEHVKVLEKKLPNYEKKQLNKAKLIHFLKSTPYHTDPKLFQSRFSVEDATATMFTHHETQVVKLANYFNLIPELCLKCWGIIFVKKEATMRMDKATGARVSFPVHEVFVISKNREKQRKVIRHHAKASKYFLHAVANQACRQEFYPHVVLPDQLLFHDCWQSDLVDSIDCKELFKSQTAPFNAENNLGLLEGKNGHQVEVNDPGLSATIYNDKRVFKPQVVNDALILPPSASIRDLPLVKMPRHSKQLATDNLPIQVNSAKPPNQLGHDIVVVVPSQEPIPSMPVAAKPRLTRLKKNGNAFRNGSLPSERTSKPSLPQNIDGPRLAASDLRKEMSSVSSEKAPKNAVMNLLSQPGNWKFLNFKQGDRIVKVSLEELSEAFLSHN